MAQPVPIPGPEPNMPAGTVTFLLTDIEGSTRLWEASPGAMRLALARHHQLVSEGVDEHGGVVVKTQGEGDSVFAVFRRASDAVAAALAIQRALLAESWPTPVPIRVRMALHTGEAEIRSGDYYGAAVNRCARVRAAGHGGQVLLTRASVELARHALPERAVLKDLGSCRLRDLERSEQLFQLLHPDLPADFPALRVLEAFPNNLPAQSTSFIGRERELADVKRLLGETRLLTLSGAGGCGKTRLALHAAADLLEDFADGVWLVELAPLSDPSIVPQAVASVLGVREQPARSITDSLLDTLKARTLLLVLDNCEHLVSACAALLESILRGCPPVKVLASSREGLRLTGELLYRVPSLGLPRPGTLPGPDELEQHEAVRLFKERAAFVLPGFAITETNARAVAQICHQLDGIPLAIELAAARIGTLSPDEMQSRLDNRFRLLTAGSRTALPRQQTLRALIDWSYDLLSPEERRLLLRLSIFAGGWTLEAAEAVCGDCGSRISDFGIGEPPTAKPGVARPGNPQSVVQRPPCIPQSDVLEILAALVDKSLVIAEPQQGRTRYRLLETVREYARDRLRETGGDDDLRDRHLEFFLRLALEADPELRGPEQALWSHRLQRDADNLRAALGWSIESQGRDARSGAAAGVDAPALQLAGALTWFWFGRGEFAEGRRWFERALGRGHRSAGPAPLRAKACSGAGTLAYMQGDYTVAASWHERALAFYQAAEDSAGVARTLINLAAQEYGRGDWERAAARAEDGLRRARDLGRPQDQAHALNLLGDIRRAQGADERARRLYEESLALLRTLQDTGYIVFLLTNLAALARRRGDLAGASALLEEAFVLLRQSGDVPQVAHCLAEQASVAGMLGEARRAAVLSGAAAGVREVVRMPLQPVERAEADECDARVRAALGAETFDAAWALGRAMSLEEAIAFALEEDSCPGPGGV